MGGINVDYAEESLWISSYSGRRARLIISAAADVYKSVVIKIYRRTVRLCWSLNRVDVDDEAMLVIELCRGTRSQQSLLQHS